jgi:hypothetical protein
MTTPPSLFAQLLAQAAQAANQPEEPRPGWPANPFATGVRSGSATDAVLTLMRSEPKRWWCHSQLVWQTGRGRGAVTWALAYLEQQGLIRSIPFTSRPPYRRYQAKVGGDE